MKDEVASIWTRIKWRGCRSLVIEGIYHEHKLLLQGYPNLTDNDDLQSRQWRKFLNQWANASRDADCFVIGDINLDSFKWNNPEYINKEMVQQAKDKIETLNFSQIIVGATRAWPDKADSLIDHCWTNCPLRVISKRNLVRATGDHNVLEITIRIKGTGTRKRNWKLFNLEKLKSAASNIRWEELYSMTNLDLANSWLVDELNKILNIEAPWKTYLPRKNCRNWVSEETKKKNVTQGCNKGKSHNWKISTRMVQL